MTENESQVELADPAAVFACALSLREACRKHAATEQQLNLSEAYNGIDEFMRVMMRVGTRFETWACLHVAFDELDDVWPYFLEDRFGDACLQVMPADAIASFDDSDCLRVALQLQLPIKADGALPLPICVSATNLVSGAGFAEYRIQTVRDHSEDNDVVPFTGSADPFDEDYGPPYFALYGVGADGLLEYISDRRSYSEAVSLAQKLAPGINFPFTPVSFRPPSAVP